MKYILDHDMHIHSMLSNCSNDPMQTAENILEYAINNNFSKIVVTDHFWDSKIKNKEAFYNNQNFEHVSEILPLPQHESVRFEFGCETDMDTDMNIGIHRDTYDKFHFIIISTTHFHMFIEKSKTIEERAELYIKRFNKLLESDLPFHKIGVAHPTCALIANMNWEAHIEVIDKISDKDFETLFGGAKDRGCGIELNMPISRYNEEDKKRILRPYEIAKNCGCKFYFGSDAHHPQHFKDSEEKFKEIAEKLNLDEEDKFLVS